ncbi:MAG: triphosphoribosyl-dephospho-CoA synthase [Gammaproteobacteria bacterium]|nr:triphosphoribosyl-dephospho-CoA synthase [Gammaproteobacteria bacterium]MCI0591649.1 triphosphoribosyl-dephospho-CoA synthase [Gammaproteobacteria bacterium]
MPTQGHRSPVIQAILESCTVDVEALKPGNVSTYADGHGMTAEDFLRSAEITAPILGAPGLSVGERVLRSVEATQARLGCNTNLGIILLVAPLAQAALRPATGNLQERLTSVLGALDVRDAQHTFTAIRLAAPAGLGHSERYDVNFEATVPLREAMEAAQDRDRIAYQYARGYADIFNSGAPCIREYVRRYKCVKWAVVACYLGFLARLPDSHVQRKFGKEAAARVCRMAGPVEARFLAYENPDHAIPLLVEFDHELKQARFNPGTSADLTVASYLAIQLEDLLNHGFAGPRATTLVAG